MSTLRLEAVLDATNGPFKKVMKDSVNEARRSSKAVESTWAKANKSIGGFGSGAIGGALGIGALAAGARGIANMAGNINDLSESVGLNTEEFQQFSAVLLNAGGSEEVLTKGMGALISKLEDARNGSSEARDQFLKLGFSLDDIENTDARGAILKIADALKFTTNYAQTTSRVMDLLGSKIALKMIPALKVGSKEFLETGKAAKVMSDQTIRNVDAMDDNIQQFKRDTLGQIANFFVDTKKGFENSGKGFAETFMENLFEVMGVETPISTPKVTNRDIGIQAGKNALNGSGPTMMDVMDVNADANKPRRPGFWQTDRPSMSRITGNEEQFGPMLDGSTRGGFAGFGSGYFPGASGGLTSGGLTSAGLTSGGLGGGKNGDAWGQVRRGDAARAKQGKAAKDPQLEAINKSQDALLKVWTEAPKN